MATVAIAGAAVAALAWVGLRVLRPEVAVTEAVEGPVVQAFYATGTVEPVKEYPIRANLAGTLTEVLVDKGDVVRRGQVVGRVTDPEMTFRLAQARAELVEKQKLADPETSPHLREIDARIGGVRALLEIAQRELERVEGLRRTEAATQTDLDRALDRVRDLAAQEASLIAQRAARELQLQRDLAVAEAALGIAEWNEQQQQLVSPIDGVVLDRPTSQGTRVAVNDPIMVVADVRPENLVMRAAVDEEDVTQVSAGQLVRMTLYAFDRRTFTGTVSRVYDQADTTRRTFEVDVTIQDSHARLAPGMTGELAFILQEKAQAVVVPSQAVQGSAVWTVEQGRLVRRTPRIGIRSVERVEIVEGLEPGTLVVLDAVRESEAGRHVRTRWVDPQVAAGMNASEIEEEPLNVFN
jgi:multidrug efflux pump subunit AcrA (membrane-fusion protein)